MRKGDRLRCRATRRGRASLVWSSQCQHAAKGERPMGMNREILPACGYHLASTFAVDPYVRSSSKYESPVVLTL